MCRKAFWKQRRNSKRYTPFHVIMMCIHEFIKLFFIDREASGSPAMARTTTRKNASCSQEGKTSSQKEKEYTRTGMKVFVSY